VAEELDRHLRVPLGEVVWGDDQGLLDRTECPWYPSVKLFRQTQDRNWAAYETMDD